MSASRRCCSKWPTAGRSRGNAFCTSPAKSPRADPAARRPDRLRRPAAPDISEVSAIDNSAEIYLAAESDLHAVLDHIDTVGSALVIVDSVQTMSTSEVDGVTGGVTQVRAVTAALTAAAKSNGFALILVGHVTKDGAIAGPAR
ncbi:AAA domain protein [Mycobacterium ulcerans str. Harvey]|uniref:AAA domain protein n=1 Tax=Mycobacterium ulcerans str. Harvey TaxID=1299332 RepID=A0ABP3ABE4_MYCUL|nr:AAA domain protein [Mycobacterium ulcerans str. Harvey]